MLNKLTYRNNERPGNTSITFHEHGAWKNKKQCTKPRRAKYNRKLICKLHPTDLMYSGKFELHLRKIIQFDHPMNTSELRRLRLHNQLLSGHPLKTPDAIVAWMGAMQAQAPDAAKWAIGTRLGTATLKEVEDALNTGKIIRTHILRPTWHFVTAEDLHWMFDLSNPRLKPVYISYCRMLGLDEALITRAIPVLEKALAGGKHLTKPEIGNFLQNEKITADTPLLNLIISRAEMEGILCNGRIQGSKQTFTLRDEWAPRKQTLQKDEALERLARKYFTSHGPATVHDFAWWSGLSLTECRQAIDAIQSDFICETVNGRIFRMKNDIQTPPANDPSALLLPSFDEFVVSYKDRSEIICGTSETIRNTHYGKVITKNGLFSPIITLNGEIIGSWKKITAKKIALAFFEKTPKKTQELFSPEIKHLEKFYS
jgi:hypothetical protein